MIPIKIETLLEGRKVEQNQIEYKEGLNPQKSCIPYAVMQTIAELFEKFATIPFVDRINNRASMEHIRRGYLEDFIRESNSALIEELNVRSLGDLLVSEEVAEEKDEGIAIKNYWSAYV